MLSNFSGPIISSLGTLDVLVFVATLLLTFTIVAWRSHRKSNSDFLDFMVMGRSLSLPLFVGTLVSTWYGAIHRVTQISFEHGIFNFISQGLFWYFCYICFAFFVVSKVRAQSVISIPELIAQKFGSKSASLSAVLIFIKVLPIGYIVALGAALNMIFGWSMPTAMAAGTTMVVIYSFKGGLRSVVLTDFVQFLLMFAAVISVAMLSISKFGGWEFLSTALPATHLRPESNLGLGNLIVWLFIAISTTFLNPTFYQRCWAAKDDFTAKWGIVIATLCWFIFDVCTTSIGLYARATMPQASAFTAWIVYPLQILPEGMRGLFLGGVLATIISTLDSFLLMAGSLWSYDLWRGKSLAPMWVHRLMIAIMGVVAYLLASIYEGSFEALWRLVKGFFAGCMIVPLFTAIFLKQRLPDNLLATSIVFSATAMLAWKTYGPESIDSFYVGAIVSMLVIATGAIRVKVYKHPPISKLT